MYRHLSQEEIDQLTANLCIADDWNDVYVKDGFNYKRVFQVSFSGTVRLGNFEREFTLPGGLHKKSGVRYATLHNVTVGDNSCVENIENYIANYDIGENCYIKNIGQIYVEGVSSFGDGVKVAVMNETGGREVAIHSKLSAHQAYMTALYRHRPVFQQKMLQLAGYYAAKHSSSTGSIGDDVTIQNVSIIKNVRVGSFATVDGACHLENGSINSNESAPVHIGASVVCKDFIISSGSIVDDGANLERCFIGQACELTHGYSASDSLFFSNCYGGNGEACAIFAGPYTVTHHKSTLLIAGMFSFMNAGSGSNQSNHMYKLGPIHAGILERGSKTTSGSYMLFPTHVGAFSLVMGRHVDHIDTSDLPFSYLIENDNASFVAPGVNLRSVGTVRDVQKWPKRDKRRDPNHLDHINFNLLSPFTIQKMMTGRRILRDLVSVSGENCDIYTYHGAKIRNSALKKGISLYDIGIKKFLGNSIIKRLEGVEFASDEDIRKRLSPDTVIGLGDWVDMSGLICPKSEVQDIIAKVEDGTYSRIQDMNDRFALMAREYYRYEWTWVYSKIKEYYGIDPKTVSSEQVEDIVKGWKDAVVTLDKMVYDDAHKEFSLSFMTAYGADGNKAQAERDFEMVRGSFESNPFVVATQKHIRDKSALGDELIARLKKVGNR